MKKILQAIYCYSNILVRDPKTGKKEIATYHKWFGIALKITYKPL